MAANRDLSIREIDALVDFRLRLIRFSQALTEDFAALERHWHGLHDTWSDDMYDRLGTAIAEVTPGIKKYLAATEQHAAYLRRTIERARAVTEGR
jgi:hypothetical protein